MLQGAGEKMGLRKVATWAIGAFALLAVSTAAQANLLGVSAGTFPDLTGGFLKVDYNGAGHLTASGITTGYSASGGAPLVPTGTTANKAFQIDMMVNPLDGDFISGTLLVKGTIASIP